MFDPLIAWAAGLFEGEGCIRLHNNCIQLSIGSTDCDVMQRWGEIVGCGRMYGPQVRINRKPFYRWEILKHRDAVRIYELFEPWLGERRRSRFEEGILQIKPIVRKPPKKRPPKPPPCERLILGSSTAAGAVWHRRRKEKPCETCRMAERAYRHASRDQRSALSL